MRAEGRIIALVALGVLVAGCRAQVGGPDDLGEEDLSIPDDGGEVDMAGADLLCQTGGVTEVCGNGCDDDGNGYVDLDDPACSTQFLATEQSGSSALSRLILEPMPHLAVVDKNPVGIGGMAMLERSLAGNNAFLVFTAGTLIERLMLLPGGMGMASNYMPMPSFPTRDVCTFNGELIVVERGLPSVLHRFMADGQTSLGTVSIGNVLATSCASDGSLLYVAVHDQLLGSPSTFYAFDSTYLQQGGAIPMPTGIADWGGPGTFDRCMDFAWSPKTGFWGLFVYAADFGSAANTDKISGGQLFPFAFDGGSGAPLDAGVFGGIGSFIP